MNSESTAANPVHLCLYFCSTGCLKFNSDNSWWYLVKSFLCRYFKSFLLRCTSLISERRQFLSYRRADIHRFWLYMQSAHFTESATMCEHAAATHLLVPPHVLCQALNSHRESSNCKATVHCVTLRQESHTSCCYKKTQCSYTLYTGCIVCPN